MVTRVLEKSAIYWPPAPHLKERLESAPVVQPGGRGGFNYFKDCLASSAEQGIVRGMKCGVSGGGQWQWICRFWSIRTSDFEMDEWDGCQGPIWPLRTWCMLVPESQVHPGYMGQGFSGQTGL